MHPTKLFICKRYFSTPIFHKETFKKIKKHRNTIKQIKKENKEPLKYDYDYDYNSYKHMYSCLPIYNVNVNNS